MSSFIKSDLRQAGDHFTNFNQYMFDILSKLVDKSNDQAAEQRALKADTKKIKEEVMGRVSCAINEQAMEINHLREEAKKTARRILKIEKQQADELERLQTIIHEQGREIDLLRQENRAQETRIVKLEADLGKEIDARNEDINNVIITIETETEERIIHDHRITGHVDQDREVARNKIEGLRQELLARTNLDGLREEMLRENELLRSCLTQPMSVYFNAYRDSAYDRGGEEIIKYDGVTLNAGRGLNPDTGIFTCILGGTHLFTIHMATHKEKKALIALRRNGEDLASMVAQDHLKNERNVMMSQTVLLDLDAGDEVYVYAYTGTWTADWPYNHFTQFIGILLRPEQLSHWDKIRDAAELGADEEE